VPSLRSDAPVPTPERDAPGGPDDPRTLRDVAVRVAVTAARHVRARRPEVFAATGVLAEDSSVATKSHPTDPVTVVDTETEELIRGLLAGLRPDDAILGEEGGGQAEQIRGVRWVVDPIDGTVNFLYGIPAFAVSVAAQIDGVSVAGAVVDVPADAVYSATLLEADGTEHTLRCNPVSDVSVSLLATGFGYGRARRQAQGALIGRVLPQVRDIRRIGSAALDLCMVASGRVDAHFEHGLSPWDWAAGALIASEAGARVRTPAPHSMSAAGEVVIAAAPGIAAELDEVFAEAGVFDPIPD
jgi:myo-inositol-1(or 4)-monophosphatase